MTHMCCPDCGLRFSWAYVAHATTCPMCSAKLSFAATATDVLGQQLFLDAPADPSYDQLH